MVGLEPTPACFQSRDAPLYNTSLYAQGRIRTYVTTDLQSAPFDHSGTCTLEEAEGFEPSVALTTLVFKTNAFDRSATLP